MTTIIDIQINFSFKYSSGDWKGGSRRIIGTLELETVFLSPTSKYSINWGKEGKTDHENYVDLIIKKNAVYV